LDIWYNATSVPGKTIVEKIQVVIITDKATGWPEFVAIKNKVSTSCCYLAANGHAAIQGQKKLSKKMEPNLLNRYFKTYWTVME
jgi:hypothetical protein